MRREELLSRVYTRDINELPGVNKELVHNLAIFSFVTTHTSEDFREEELKSYQSYNYFKKQGKQVTLKSIPTVIKNTQTRYDTTKLSQDDYFYYLDDGELSLSTGMILKYDRATEHNVIFDIIFPKYYEGAKVTIPKFKCVKEHYFIKKLEIESLK